MWKNLSMLYLNWKVQLGDIVGAMRNKHSQTQTITTKMENKSKINVIQQNQEPSPQNTTGRNTKTLKILHVIYMLLSPSVRKNWNVQTEKNAINMRKLQHAPGIPNLAEQGNRNVPLVG
jgi:hypothetical protein